MHVNTLSSHQVVCQSCSSNKHCLEYLKNQLARVCDQCVVVLQQQKSKTSFFQALFTMTAHCHPFISMLSQAETSLLIRHWHMFYSLYSPCINPLRVSCSSGESSISAAVSPGSRATFAFSRKQKKIPAALKEVADALSRSGMLCCI